MPVEFRLLGPVQVWHKGSAVDLGPAGCAKTRCILAVLLRTPGRVVTTDALVQRVWGDCPPLSATRYKYVGWLRSALAVCDVPLVHRNDGYLLPVETGQVDLFRFRELTAQARDRLAAGAPADAAALAHRALTLWHAPSLLGLPGAWPAMFRDQLDRERRSAAVLRFHAELAAGASAGLTNELADWEAEHPLDEEIAALRIRALLLAGDRSQARACHERALERIRGALGSDPSAALRDVGGELAHRAARQTPSAQSSSESPPGDVLDDGPEFTSWRPLAQLPPDVADFVGREEEQRRMLAAVDAMTRPGHPQSVLVLSGAPGIGKSTLAVHVAHQIADRFSHGQLYVSLHGRAGDPPAASDVAARLARALGAPDAAIPSAPEDRVALWRSMTVDRTILLVLDDAADELQVRPLLPAGLRCFTLVTARSRLSGLAGVHRTHLDVPSAETALDLLARIVGADRVRREPRAAAELVASCGRLPLAVRVIGNRLDLWPDWSLSHLNERLRDERERLGLLRAGDLQVRTAIQVSYQALTTGGARLFRLLALVPGPDFDVDLAAVLLGRDRAGAGDLLDELAEASLVEATSVPGRYRFHGLVRMYAAEALREQEPGPQRDTAESAVLRWLSHQATVASALNAPPTAATGCVQPAADRPIKGETPDDDRDHRGAAVVTMVPASPVRHHIHQVSDDDRVLEAAGASRGFL